MRRERIGVFRYGDIAEGGGGEGSAEIGVENCGVEIDGAEKGEEVGAVRLAEERGMDRRGRVERREEDLERDLILIGFTCGEFVVFIFFRLIDEVSSRKMNILGANRGYTGKYHASPYPFIYTTTTKETQAPRLKKYPHHLDIKLLCGECRSINIRAPSLLLSVNSILGRAKQHYDSKRNCSR